MKKYILVLSLVNRLGTGLSLVITTIFHYYVDLVIIQKVVHFSKSFLGNHIGQPKQVMLLEIHKTPFVLFCILLAFL